MPRATRARTVLSTHHAQDEFRIPWRKIFPRLSAADFEKAWRGIDQNGDGQLSLRELADHYGYQLSPSGGGRAGDQEMTDDQILEALQMHQAMQNLQLEQEKLQQAKRAEARTLLLPRLEP